MLTKNQTQIMTALNRSKLTESELIAEISFIPSKLGIELRPLLQAGTVIFQHGVYSTAVKEETPSNKLTNEQSIIQYLALQHHRVFPKEIRQSLKIDDATCRTVMAGMKKNKLIECRGAGHYYITQKGVDFLKRFNPTFGISEKVISNIKVYEKSTTKKTTINRHIAKTPTKGKAERQLQQVNDLPKNKLEQSNFEIELTEFFQDKDIKDIDEKVLFLNILSNNLPAKSKQMALAIRDDFEALRG